MKILIIEDDSETSEFIARGFKEHGHIIETADNGRDGLFIASDGKFDAMIVDRMIPGLDGLSVVRMLRATKVRTPILMLTTMVGIDDRVDGLEAGADDYLVKPFAFAELYARILALARRPPLATIKTSLTVGPLVIDLLQRSATRGGRPIELLPQEFKLLEYMMRHEGRVVTRTMLLEHVWDFHFDPKTTIVETHISRLRAKIDRGQGKELIKTIRGVGYKIDDT